MSILVYIVYSIILNAYNNHNVYNKSMNIIDVY